MFILKRFGGFGFCFHCMLCPIWTPQCPGICLRSSKMMCCQWSIFVVSFSGLSWFSGFGCVVSSLSNSWRLFVAIVGCSHVAKTESDAANYSNPCCTGNRTQCCNKHKISNAMLHGESNLTARKSNLMCSTENRRWCCKENQTWCWNNARIQWCEENRI